jgi:hypothetical protein
VDVLKTHPVATRTLAPCVGLPVLVGAVLPKRGAPVVLRAEVCHSPQENLEMLMAQAIAMRRR